MVGAVSALALLAALATGPTAHAGRAGYDTNHPDVRYNTLETEHFYFHWPESSRPVDDPHWFTTEFTVHELARIAEEAWPLICGELDYYLEEKVHVVLYDQDNGWEGNGFAIAEWDWTGFAARWGSTFRQRGRMEFLTDVFVHEFAHIVSLKAYLPWSEGTTGFQLGGLAEDEEWLRRWGIKARPHTNADFGFDLLVTAHTPFWWAEGGAEYWSHRAGTNFWGTSRDAFLRMTVLEDRLLDVDEWTTRIDKVGFDGERGYNQGYSFGLYLADRFDKNVYTDAARISAERWHWSWDTVMEEATGEPMDALYAGWVASLTERYQGHAAEVRARGLVTGGELSLTKPPWEAPVDEDWATLSKARQDEAMDGNTAYEELPTVSPDGRTMTWFAQGLQVREIRPSDWGAVSGAWLDEDDKTQAKRIEAYGRRTAEVADAEYYRVSWAPESERFVFTHREDYAGKPAFVVDNGLQFNADGYNWNQLAVATLDRAGKRLELDVVPIPGTLRATEAAWSPDGSTIAFARYGDGTHNLWSVAPDGSGLRRLTDFRDGTQVQGLSWTPDGTRLLVSLFRNFQQDLWTFELASGQWTRLTDSAADETDPIVGPDGRYWFTSDTDLVFNVYSLDPAAWVVRKHTEVLGGAYGATVSGDGHLFYTAITGHGFRNMGVNAAALKQEVVDYPGLCGPSLQACAPTPAADLVAPPRTLDVAATSRPYRGHNALMPLSGWPVLRTTDKNVEAGGGFFLGDYSEAHYIEGEATFGKDNYFYASYWLNRFWPTVLLGYSRYTYKGTYGYGVDADGVAETDDVTVVDVKFEQASDDVWAYFTYIPSYALWGGIGVDASRYSFRDAGDGSVFVPYTQHAGVGLFLEWTPSGADYSGDQWINPRGGRRLYIDAQHRWTRLVDPEVAGAVYDDGELLEAYGYNQLSASYTEYVPVSWFGLVDHHTLQLDFEAGFIDRNVMGWDEFIAGGRHPYHWGSGTIGNNVQFSGYEGWSLSGETLLIANASYRFPLLRDLDLKLGPTYTESIYLQVFGSVGNLWSYRVDGPSHLEGYSVVADDPGAIRREVPFADYASKNSPPGAENRLLEDIGAEVRIRSFIWNDWDWDSFVRVAYGLDRTAGYGDVNADLIQSSVARDAASELSDEVEPPTLRVYAGLGTGW